MSSEEETPCNSNDYQLSLYSSLLDDDEFIMNILPCVNSTAIINEDGGLLSSGGAGESSVEATVASRTTPAIAIENGAVAWETTEVPQTTTEEATTTSTTTTEQTTTTPTPLLFSTVASEPDVANVNANGKEEVEAINSANANGGEEEKNEPDANAEGSNESNANVPSEPTDSESKEQHHSSGESVHEETSKTSSFYTCHPDPSSLQSGDFAPDDSAANKYEIVYDYDLLTKADAGSDVLEETLAGLENTMTEDVAKQVGLVDCEAKKLRRGLKKNKRTANGVVALDSDPLDEALEGQCECYFVIWVAHII